MMELVFENVRLNVESHQIMIIVIRNLCSISKDVRKLPVNNRNGILVFGRMYVVYSRLNKS
jgi:hypothetical protein